LKTIIIVSKSSLPSKKIAKLTLMSRCLQI